MPTDDRLDLSVKAKAPDDARDRSIFEVCKALCPLWADVALDQMSVSLVKGGVTNVLFKASSPAAPLLVRVYGDKTELIIDREKETNLLRQLSEAGASVPFFGCFANGRLEGWTEMRALKHDEMASATPVDNPQLIAEQLAHLHALPLNELGNPERRPQLFPTTEAWAKQALLVDFGDSPDRQAKVVRMDIPRMVEELQWLMTVLPSNLNEEGAVLLRAIEDSVEQSAAQFAFASVFCHNDLFAGNILVADDHCKLIDFEYGCYNHRAFDFANHFVEYAGLDGDWAKWHPTDEEMLHFLKSYMAASEEGRKLLASLPSDAVRAKFLHSLLGSTARFCLASHLFWGFWGVIQARNSAIDFDFLDYGRTCFAGYFYKKGLYARHLFLH